METEDKTNLKWLLEFKQDKLIQKVVSNLNTFENADYIKLTSLLQLQILLKQINKKLTFPQFSQIYNSLVKQLVIFYDQKEFKNVIFQVAQLLGSCLPLDQSFSLISQSIQKDIDKDSQKTLIYNLSIVEHITSVNFKVEKFENFFIPLIDTLYKMLRLLRENDVIAYKVLLILQNVLKNTNENLQIELEKKEKIFQIFFLLKSNEKLQSFDLEELIKILALKQQQTVDELVRESCKKILHDFYSTKNYYDWESQTLERIEFNQLIKNATQIVWQFLDIILEIIQYQLSNDKDFITQFDSLEALNTIITSDKQNMLQPFTLLILENIIEKSLVWKVGSPNSKIRKTGVMCFKNFIQMQNFDKEILLQRFQKYLPLLATNAGDDRAADVRFVTMEFCIYFLELLKDELQRDDITKFYEVIIFRLDDAQDEIRIKSAIGLQKIFTSKNVLFPTGIKEYILKTLFIHFDDSNENLRNQILIALENFAKNIDKKMTQEIAESSIQKYRFPKQCKQLIQDMDNINQSI